MFFTISTDASKEGWGAYFGEYTASGNLLSCRMQVTYKLKAVFLALKEFQDLCSEKTIIVVIYNTTVVARINKEGGMSSGPLSALLCRFLTWCFRNQVTLKAQHIPGGLNVVADKLSKLGQTKGKLVAKLQDYPCRRIILIAPG